MLLYIYKFRTDSHYIIIQSLFVCVTLLFSGDVVSVRKAGCNLIEWDAPVGPDGCAELLIYKIRLFSGTTFLSSSREQRLAILSGTTSLTYTAEDMPEGEPIKATVSV